MSEISAHAQKSPDAGSSWPTSKLSLASLTPESASSRQGYLEGVITLLWPFSVSGSTLSILVCEEDFRLRISKGQLRVIFRGPSALEVNQRNVQIGKHVQLSVEGATLEMLDDATSRDVPWSLVYSNRLIMKVKDSSGWNTIDVDVLEEVVKEEEEEEEEEYPSSTIVDNDEFLPQSPSVVSQSSETKWSTLGAFKRKGALISPSPLFLQQLFGDDYEFDINSSRPSKRTRFSSGSYRLVDRTPSPTPSGIEPTTIDSDLDPAVSNTEDDTVYRGMFSRTHPTRPTHIEMPPPPLPANHGRDDSIETRNEGSKMPDSPCLKPVPSPQLPLVSPFLHAGLSASDYMSISLDISSEPIQFDNQENPTESIVATELKKALPTAETWNDAALKHCGYRPLGAKFSITPEGSRPTTSDGESEKDSLFDELSDKEDGRLQRIKNRSPLHGPAPLHAVESAKNSHTMPSKPSKLGIQITTPHTQSQLDSCQSGISGTPHLYLPTPSPKVTSFGHTAFPFGVIELSDFAPKIDKTSLDNRESMSQEDVFAHSESIPQSTTKHALEHDNAVNVNSITRVSITPGDEEGNLEESNANQQGLIRFKSGITTPLSDFPPLAFVSWGMTIDIIGVMCFHTPIIQSKAGLKDYKLSIKVVDSSQPSGIMFQIFRPHKSALPVLYAGDVVLLRSFKIIPHKHKFVGVSTENSAWAVWNDHGQKKPGICAGAPVEYGADEEDYVEAIGKWYSRLDAKKKAAMEGSSNEDEY